MGFELLRRAVRSRRALSTLVGALAAVPTAPPLQAQVQIPLELSPAAPSLPPMAQADTLFFQDPMRSLAYLEGVLARRSDDYEAQWRAARAALSLGILEDASEAELAWVERAVKHADAALALDSSHVDGLFWVAASKGRLALHHGPKTSSELAQEVWELAHRLLELDPDHGGGHNILGKLNQEVMSLSGWQRFLGRLVLRTEALRSSSWEEALRHHREAVAAEPGAVLFHLDLGRTLELSGAPDEARQVYTRALALPPLYPVDEKFQRLIRLYLEELDG